MELSFPALQSYHRGHVKALSEVDMLVSLRLLLGFVCLLMTLVLAAFGCTGGASSTPSATAASTSGVSRPVTTSPSSSTARPPASATTTLPSTPQGLRIGAMIPAEILYQGRLYVGGGSVLRAGKAVPADLSLVGTAAAAAEDGAPVAGSSYRAFAVKGTDPSQAIALEFTAASDEGPVSAWITYRRK